MPARTTGPTTGARTRTSARTRAPGTRRPAGAVRRADLASVFLLGYVTLLLALPSQLVLGPLGAPGTPANLWAIAGLTTWAAMTVGGLNPVRGLTRTRGAVIALVVVVLLAYGSAMVSGWYAPASVRQSTDAITSVVPTTLDQVSAAMVKAADRGLLSLAGWVGIVLIAAEGLRSWADLERLVRWTTGLGAVVGAIGVLQFATGVDLVSYLTVPGLTLNVELGGITSRADLNRVSSTAVHPIELGVVMASLVPLALHVAIHRWRARGGALAVAVVVLLFAGAAVSVSRTAVLVLAVALAVLFLGWSRRWRVRALWCIPAALVGLVLVAPGLVDVFVGLFADAGTDTSVTGRTSDYAVVLGLYADHPLLGRGLFTFVPEYYRVVDNQLLIVLVELGVVGLVVVLGFLLTAWTSARTALRRAATPRQRHLGLAISAAILGGSTSLVTFDAWSFPMCAGMSFLLVGLAGGAQRLATQAESAGPDAPGRAR